jgi:hypothetical protein
MPENSHPIPSPVDLAALIYDCDTQDLLSYHEFPDGSVTIIAPTGQKFHYSAARIHEMLLEVTEDDWPQETLDETPADFDGQQVFNEVLDQLLHKLDLDSDQSAVEPQSGSEFNQPAQPAGPAAAQPIPEQELEEQNESTDSNCLPSEPASDGQGQTAEASSALPHPTEVETSTKETGGANAAKKRKPRSSNRRKESAQSPPSSSQDD